MMKKLILGMVLIMTAALSAGCMNATEDARIQLIRDPDFEGGFALMSGGSPIGSLPMGDKSKARYWLLRQNNSRYFIKTDALKESSDNKTVYENEGKKVSRYIDENGDAVLNYAKYCNNEYETPRTKPDDPWVHLMFEQIFENPVRLIDYESLELELSVRINEFINHMDEDVYKPGIMCAQTNIYFILRNKNSQSDDYQSFIWLGINMFDNRYEMTQGTFMMDVGFEGATNTLIYTPRSDKYFETSVHDGEWHHIKADMLELVAEALEKAQQKEVFKSTNIDDLYLENIYISSETSGNFTVEYSFKNLGLYAVEKAE